MFSLLGNPRAARVLAASSVIAIAASISSAHAQEQAHSFNIEAQPLASALLEFSRQSDTLVVADPAVVAGRQAPAVQGSFTSSDALNRLLAGSGLSAAQRPGGGFVLADASSPTQLGAADRAAPRDAESEGFSEDIIVTGTSLRGVAPAGAETITLGEGEIAASGASTTAQLLSTIPQISDFGDVPTIQVGVNGPSVSVNRPNLRGIGGGVGSSSATLILMDGRRLPGSGVVQNFPDPDIIPPGVIQRVEVAPDGGSATYGADAVGGVINFITRRDFDGVEFNVRQAFGDSYDSTDAYVTAGKDWGAGSAYISYNYSHTSDIYGYERDYVRSIDWSTGIPLGRSCPDGNVVIAGTSYAIDDDGLDPNTFNACDLARSANIFPDQRRDSVFAGFTQDLTSDLSFDFRAWYTRRHVESDMGPLRSTGNITSANPYYRLPDGAAGTQQVSFDFSSVSPTAIATNTLETWGFTPELAWNLGRDWQARAFLNYGHSVTTTHNPIAFGAAATAALAGTTFATALNPYDVSATQNQAIVASILNRENFGQGENELANARLVVDGPLIDLPGGEVRAAFGAEYIDESYRGRTNTSVEPALAEEIPLVRDQRRVSAFFAELSVPLIGPDNEFPLVHALNLSLSARRDRYPGFGGVTSPRIGLTYEPLDWITLRANWSESFQAPALASTATVGVPGISARVGVPGNRVNPLVPASPTQSFMAATGSTPLLPQEATSYSFGFDIAPPWVEGLRVSATYWNIDYRGRIGPTPSDSSFYLSGAYDDLFEMGDADGVPGFTEAEVRSFFSFVPEATLNQALTQIGGDVSNLYVIWDNRQRNLGVTITDGVDFAASYNRETDFGSLFWTFGAAYLLTAQDARAEGLPLEPNTAGFNGARLTYTTTLGATFGEHWLAQLTLNHLDDFAVAPTTLNLNQTRVDDFNVFNLYTQYDVLGSGLTEDLTLSFGVNNLLDEEPPLYRGDAAFGSAQTSGYVGQTLGRVFVLGLSKTF
jgi:iron complex outermembrane receptor protein